MSDYFGEVKELGELLDDMRGLQELRELRDLQRTLRLRRMNRASSLMMLSTLDFCEDMVELQRHFGPVITPHHLLRDRQNPVEMLDEETFRITFGIGKRVFAAILDRVSPKLTRRRECANPTVVPVLWRLLIFLQFLQTNEFQRSVGTRDFFQVSQSVVCLTVNEVANIFAEMVPEAVKLPSVEEARVLARKASAKVNGIPGVFGALKGSHFRISKPVGQDYKSENFLNRKNYYSLNSLIMCDADKRIRYFVCKHPGSSHDALIWESSALKTVLEGRKDETKDEPLFLVGGDCFRSSDLLLTGVKKMHLAKIKDPVLMERCVKYNEAHERSRAPVEECLKALKMRFPALLFELRPRKMRNAVAIISSGVVLHNWLLDFGEEACPPEPKLPPGKFELLMKECEMEDAPLDEDPFSDNVQLGALREIIEKHF